MTAPVEVVDLEKWWTSDSGLRPVTFTAAAGELIVVRGRSGSGKSTLLAILAGWCRADGGHARIAGKLLDGYEPSWEEVGVVPQVLALAPELTVLENIADAGAATRPDRVRSLVALLDLVEVGHRPPTAISIGQQQRAAVARAMASSPLVLLADEPTSHQDPDHVQRVIAALTHAAESGSAVLVASHDPWVAGVATRVVDLEP